MNDLLKRFSGDTIPVTQVLQGPRWDWYESWVRALSTPQPTRFAQPPFDYRTSEVWANVADFDLLLEKKPNLLERFIAWLRSLDW